MLRPVAALLISSGLAGSASGSLVAEAQEGPVRVELHDVQGPCQGSARWAQYQEGKIRISGCWVVTGEVVQIAWLDGDVSQIAARVFKKPKDL